MAITSGMEANLAIFSEDGMTHIGFVKISKGVTMGQIFWTTFSPSGAQDDFGMGKQEGNNAVLCPGQTPAAEHKMNQHTKDCSMIHDFNLTGFDTEQIHDFDVNTRVKVPMKAKCKFIR